MTKIVAFDVETSDIPALDVVFPVPTHVEKSGHWVNVDGHVGVLNVAVPPPSGVRRLDAHPIAPPATPSAARITTTRRLGPCDAPSTVAPSLIVRPPRSSSRRPPRRRRSTSRAAS